MAEHRDTVDAWITNIKARKLEVDEADEDALKHLLARWGRGRLGCFFGPFQQEPSEAVGVFRRNTNFREILIIIEQEKELRKLVLAGCMQVELRLEHELREAYLAAGWASKFLEPEFYGADKEGYVFVWKNVRQPQYQYNAPDDPTLRRYTFGTKVNLLIQTGFSELGSDARKAGMRVSDAFGNPTLADQLGPESNTILTLAVNLHHIVGLRNIVSHNTVLWENRWDQQSLPGYLIGLRLIPKVSSSMGAINTLTKVLDQMDKETHTKSAAAITDPIRALVGAPELFVAGLENRATAYLRELKVKETSANNEPRRDESFTEMPTYLGNTQSLDEGRQP